MITSQLISFKDGFIGTTMNAAQSISEVLTSMQLSTLICAITAIAAVVFGAYKLAMYLGYFSPKDPRENEYGMPKTPPHEENPPGYIFVSPSSPPLELAPSESSRQMQEEIFEKYYPNFGHSS